MQKIARLTNELVQRTLCRTKKHAFFLHSKQALPSILLVTSHHQQTLQPLIRTLTQKQQYPLLSTIRSYSIRNAKVVTDVKTSVKSLQGIELSTEALIIRVGEGGKLTVLPKVEEGKGDIVGALLFASDKDTVISYGQNVWMENAVLIVRLVAMVGLWQLYQALWQSTRPENHPA